MKLVALLIVLVLFGLIGWQELRYLRSRRGPVQDSQRLFYPPSTLHVLSLLRAADGADVIEAVRKLRSDLEASGQAEMVYAGRSSRMGIASDQLGEADWDAAVLVQYPSREIFEALSKTQPYRMALERFSKTYSYGLDRPVLLNLAIPLALGALRIRDLVTRRPARLPFESAASDQLDSVREISDERLSQLDGLRQYSEDAVVVVNLLRGGTRDQRAADRGYGLQMAGLFAEGGHGPTHMGRAVKLEGDAEFDRIALVYYPGVEYMKSMLRSTFFNGIVGGKQPGDTLALPTVPILSRL